MRLRKFLAWTAVVLFIGTIFVMTTWVTPTYRVTSGSMSPIIPVGSTIVTRHYDSYQKGDIVTFHSDDQSLVTHRIIDIGPAGEFITKGDANQSTDNWIYPITTDRIVGKVIAYTPFTGLAGWFSLRGVIILAGAIMILVLARLKIDEEVDEVHTPSEVS